MKRRWTLLLSVPLLALACRTNDVDSTTTATAATSSQPATQTQTVSVTASSQPTATATTTTAASTIDINDTAKAARITVPELKAKLDAGTAVILDVRAASAYEESHVKGSLNVPIAEFESHIAELPKDKFLATYCT